MLRTVKNWATSARRNAPISNPQAETAAPAPYVEQAVAAAPPDLWPQIVEPPRQSWRTQWWQRLEWLEPYRRYIAHDAIRDMPATRILDRRFQLIQLARMVRGLSGSTAECGVFRGVGSGVICQTLNGSYEADQIHFGFDSFSGLPAPGSSDLTSTGASAWKQGDLVADMQETTAVLADFSFCRLVQGWIPQCLTPAAEYRFRLLHIDVDLHQPTLATLEFFYERMIPGGVIIFDDHGFLSCPGARSAAEEFFRDKPEPIVELVTGQAFIVKA